MSNRVLLILLTVLLCACVAGCRPSTPDATEPPSASTPQSADALSIDAEVVIQEGSLSNTGATFLIQNNETDHAFLWGGYGLEKYADGEWQKLSWLVDTYSTTLVGYQALPGRTLDRAIDWEYLYGELSPGQYRSVIYLTLAGSDGTDYTKSTTEFCVYVPFEL